MKRTRSPYPTLRPRSGYTMVEMILVTSVMGVISLMSAGRISTYVQERNVAAAAMTVRNDLQQAFAIAARNRHPVRVSYSSSDTAIRLTDRENTVTYVRRGLGNGSGFMLRPSDVAFCASSCSSPSIDVYPNGWASDSLTVIISRGSSSRSIRMTRSGLVVTR
jgi:prepilin-type N-terminal cleavage/methylation domain-containing protein